MILPGCATAADTAYTRISLFAAFLESQGVPPPPPPPPPAPEPAPEEETQTNP